MSCGFKFSTSHSPRLDAQRGAWVWFSSSEKKSFETIIRTRKQTTRTISKRRCQNGLLVPRVNKKIESRCELSASDYRKLILKAFNLRIYCRTIFWLTIYCLLYIVESTLRIIRLFIQIWNFKIRLLKIYAKIVINVNDVEKSDASDEIPWSKIDWEIIQRPLSQSFWFHFHGPE